MNRFIAVLAGLLVALSAAADVHIRPINVATTVDFKLYNADGTLDTDEVDGGTEVSLSCAGGAETTATNDFVDEGTFYSIALTQAEMNCARIAVIVAATTTEVFFIDTVGSGGALGILPANAVQVGSQTASASGTITFPNATLASTTNITAGTITTTTNLTNLPAITAGWLTATGIASDAITAAKIANGALDAATYAADVDAEFLSYIVDDATRIDASELNGDIDSLTFTVAGDVDANMQGISDDTAAANALELAWDGTAGQIMQYGIARQFTAQSATSTTLVMDTGAAFADDTAIGMTIVACGSTQGYCQARAVTDNVLSTDTLTVEAWTVTPSGTITGYLFSTAPGGSGGLDAAGVRAAVGLASANLDTQLTAIDDYVDTEVAAILVDTSTTLDDLVDDLETRLTATRAGYLDNLSAGAVATAAALDTVDNYVDTEVAAILADTGTDGVVLAAGAIDAIWDEAQSGHVTAGSFGVYLDSAVSGVSTGGVSAADLADAVWDEALSGHATGGTAGAALTTASGAAGLDAAGVRAAIGLASANLDTQLTAIDDYVDTEVAAILVDTGTTLDAALAVVDGNVDAILVDTGTTLQGELDGIQADTEDLQSRTPAALVGGRMDATIDATGMESGATAAIVTALNTEQRVLSGTCSSGSTTTCIDAALTQAAEAQLDDRLICFDDSWCALITGFTPGTDTVTTTKTAPSTRSGKAYTIYPATAQ